MEDGGLTNQQMKTLKSKINDPTVDPALRKQLKFMLDVITHPQKTQDEQDRRWRNMSAYFEALPEDQKPTTLGGHRDILAKFGFKVRKMSEADAARVGHFGDFMESYGTGLSMMDSYEMKGKEDAKPRCDHCKKKGATMRCKQCGEWYCSRECQKADWPLHKGPCKLIAEQRTYSQILDL